MTAVAEIQKPKDNSSEVLEHIKATKPLLFNMAEQVLAAVDDRPDRWNIIIGDDAGGRLPTRFIHDILKLDGRDVQTSFVASSGVYRKANGPEPYQAYFQHLAEQLGEPLRPLVVTESVSTGSTVDFLRKYLSEYSSTVPEFAAVAVEEGALDKVDFVGGIDEEEIKEVWHAFESPPSTELSLGRRALRTVWGNMPVGLKEKIKSRSNFKINTPTMNETVGIYADVDSAVPVAKRHPDRDGQKSTDAYRLVDGLALEAYSEIRKNTDTELLAS